MYNTHVRSTARDVNAGVCSAERVALLDAALTP
jgi:hypothetical protein